MRKNTNRMRLFSLILLSPFLTAFTKLGVYTGDDGYRDFTISYKKESFKSYPDSYTFDVSNTGDKYIELDHIFAYSSEGQTEIGVFKEGAAKSFRYLDSNVLIKPGETKKFHSIYLREEILNGHGLYFSAGTVEAENDYVNVTGPYTCSLKKDDYGHCLNIKCNINQLKELDQNDDLNRINTFYYAVSITIDGEEVCVTGKHYLDNIVQVYLNDSIDFDLENVTVNKIEGFRGLAYNPNGFGTSNKSTLFIVFGSCLLVALLGTTILVTYKLKKRKIVN